MKRNLIQFSPKAKMYQNGHPTHWFLEIDGLKIEVESVGDAAERLINSTFSIVASEQETLTKAGIELKLMLEAMRNTICNWHQLINL
tara:strand:+ start:56 stop:316 length:261 start_codon:yes stop_codon:yes gene_type:complete